MGNGNGENGGRGGGERKREDGRDENGISGGVWNGEWGMGAQSRDLNKLFSHFSLIKLVTQNIIILADFF